jgi:predicted RNase H-like HicB family nuclease
MSYEVELERDERGAWLARVPSAPGCHTHGRSLRQAKNRIRQALSLWVNDADEAELTFRYRLPSAAQSELRRVRIARERAAAVQREARLATYRSVRYLDGELGLSVRDIAELLGLSHQRVQQLLAGQPTAQIQEALPEAAAD